MSGNVLMTLIEPPVLGNVMEVIPTHDDGIIYLGRD